MKPNLATEDFFCRLVKDGALLIQQDGTVLNTKTLKVYDRKSKKGHIHIAWKDNGQTKHVLAHRLIYRVVIGPLDSDDQVCHEDGNRANNRPSNLFKTNQSGSTRHYNDLNGINSAAISAAMVAHHARVLQTNCKLSPEQVMEVRRRYAAGETRWRLARDFRMDFRAINNIVNGSWYRAVPMNP